MVKTMTVYVEELEYMTNTIAYDGMKIASLEAELAAAKEDIKRLIQLNPNKVVCKFCATDPEKCVACEYDAVWRGVPEGVKTNGDQQQTEGCTV